MRQQVTEKASYHTTLLHIRLCRCTILQTQLALLIRTATLHLLLATRLTAHGLQRLGLVALLDLLVEGLRVAVDPPPVWLLTKMLLVTVVVMVVVRVVALTTATASLTGRARCRGFVRLQLL